MATLLKTELITQVIAQGQNNSILALDEWAKNETFQNDLERITEPGAATACFFLAFALGAFSALLSKENGFLYLKWGHGPQKFCGLVKITSNSPKTIKRRFPLLSKG